MNREKMKMGYMVKEIPFYASDLHKLIGVENSPEHPSLDNIGMNGLNLTIAVLSMNRAYLTIRLMESVKNQLEGFRGEFLIGDNASDESEKEKIRAYMREMPFGCRMIEFDANYGVAGGRNRLFREVRTDWIFSLDNDIYFTSNPLKKIQHDINALGVQFLVMPLKDKNDKNGGILGSHLYVENKDSKCAVGLGSTFLIDDMDMDVEEDGFLCTALPGTAAIINNNTFLSVGGYETEDNMFVGFEDTEFSIRLFQKGYKIGCCGITCLCHDHPTSKEISDIEYEEQRFSNRKLYESAKYLEKKAGFHVWDNATSDWVSDRQNNVGVGNKGNQNIRIKKRIMLVADRPDWALDHVAREIICNLSYLFDFRLIYGTDIDNVTDVFILAENYDMVHFLWRGHLAGFWDEYAQKRIEYLGLNLERFYEKYICGKVISTEVYDHLCLTDAETEITHKLFYDERSILTNYTVSSKKLWHIYNNEPELFTE